MKMLKKMSAATLMTKVPTRVIEITTTDPNTGEQVKENVVRGIEQVLFRVAGIAHNFKTGKTTYGDWFSFTGQFEAVNRLTGEVFRSANLFLPDVVTEQLLPIVKANGETGVELAFDVGVKPFNNAQGYEYTVDSLIPVAANDPLSMLTARLLGSVKPLVIEAPKAADAPNAEAVADAERVAAAKKEADEKAAELEAAAAKRSKK